MAPTHRTLDCVDWNDFVPDKVDDDLLAIVKAVSLLECNAMNYAAYLCKVFVDDPAIRSFIRTWAEEEVEHGMALGHWVELADTGYDFQAATRRFRQVFQIPEDYGRFSFRGTPFGELIAQSIVETGTSSLYSAMSDCSNEPVLQTLCKNIANDELRHYDYFIAQMKTDGNRNKIGQFGRLKLALDRIAEIKDDEIACAYHVANLHDRPYERKKAAQAYQRRAFRLYNRRHVELGVAMAAKACGFRDTSAWIKVANPIVWWLFTTRVRQLERIPA